MAELPRPLVGRIILQARLMELAEQPAVVALVHCKPTFSCSQSSTLLCVYSASGRIVGKLASWESGSLGPAVALPLPPGVDAHTAVARVAALPALRLYTFSPADVLCGLASVKTASALLSKTEWPRGLEEELCSRMTFAESATNVSWPGKLENYLRPYAKLVLA